MVRTISVFVVAVFIVALGDRFGVARTWTDQKGREVEGELLSWQDGKVSIKRDSDGKACSILVTTRSDADQAFVRTKATEGEMKRLNGSWIFDHARSPDGWVVTTQGLNEALIIQEGSFRKTRLGEGPDGKLVIDPTQAPKTIDVKFSPKDEKPYTLRGIYDLVKGEDGEALVIAFGEPDKARPKDLNKSRIEVYFHQ